MLVQKGKLECSERVIFELQGAPQKKTGILDLRYVFYTCVLPCILPCFTLSMKLARPSTLLCNCPRIE